jgi:hypothetical protein
MGEIGSVSCRCQRRAWLAAVLLAAFGFACEVAAAAEAWTFRLRLADTLRTEPYSGRVYVFLSRRQAEPRLGPGWFNPEPFLSLDVSDWRPDEPLDVTPSAAAVLTFPRTFPEELTGYRAQAVARFNAWERNIGTGPGNAFSSTVALDAGAKTVEFVLKQTVPERPFVESDWSRLLDVRSMLLSEFHGRDVHLRAAVTLPASYRDQPDRRYPVIFEVPGFGGTHHAGRRSGPVNERNEGGVEFLRVLLDPSSPLGHHVFADSANNGPAGQSLVTELIPEFDRQYRTIAEPGARFLTGHSSGGWSSLWLQVTYPDVFGGVWSISPDPVDFRDFQRINLYRAGENMFVDPAGSRRPLARRGGQVLIWYDDFSWMEHVLGPGGQLHSFEAVFSPRGRDGKPRPVWDRHTGAVDAEAARTWEQYDVRIVLERNWESLGPRLAGRLHVFMGDQDTFYLDGATALLKESLEQLGSDAVVEILAGHDHGSLLTPTMQQRIRGEMVEAFLERFPGERRATVGSR